MPSNTRMISLKMPEAMIQALDQLVKMKLHPSRSEAIRTAIRDLILKELGGW